MPRSNPLRLASRLSAIPGLGLISPSPTGKPSSLELEGYRVCQKLAWRAAEEIASHLREGWTEKRAAGLLNTFLLDHGVQSFFHEAFVWFSDRTRFEGIRHYSEYQATDRALQPGQVYILDVAPIYQGYLCDIGYTACLGENAEWKRSAKVFGDTSRGNSSPFLESPKRGGEIWTEVGRLIEEAGYETIHAKYPFSVLGHRVPRVGWERPRFRVLNFGWQSYWALLSRGLFGQLLNQNHEGDLTGLWAIEPHIGWPGGGAKFEEILVVEEGQARWLEIKNPVC